MCSVERRRKRRRRGFRDHETGKERHTQREEGKKLKKKRT